MCPVAHYLPVILFSDSCWGNRFEACCIQLFQKEESVSAQLRSLLFGYRVPTQSNNRGGIEATHLNFQKNSCVCEAVSKSLIANLLRKPAWKD